MRIACVITNMEAGGAQRVMAHLCNHFVDSGAQVRLLTLSAPHEAPFFPLDAEIEHTAIGRTPRGGGMARFARVGCWVGGLRREIRRFRPDAVLSFIDTTNIMTLLATRGLGVPVLVSERVDPTAYAHRLSPLDHRLRRLAYPRANRIIVQTQRAARAMYRLAGDRLVVLPNPVPDTPLRARTATAGANGRFRMIGVGRLDEQKGFDLLVPAFARLAGIHPEWDLDIYGEGRERERLQGMVQQFGLTSRVSLHGNINTMPQALAASHLMAFPSRYEGFPNALAEAMTVGLPAVAFRDVSGVEDLLKHDQSGLLVARERWRSDAVAVQSLASALDQMMQDQTHRLRLGERALVHVGAFHPSRILPRWTQVVESVVAEGKMGIPARRPQTTVLASSRATADLP